MDNWFNKTFMDLIMELVYTKLGNLPRADLEIKDEIAEDDKARYVKTTWFYKGELVRQDAWVNLKHGLNTELQGGLNG